MRWRIINFLTRIDEDINILDKRCFRKLKIYYKLFDTEKERNFKVSRKIPDLI